MREDFIEMKDYKIIKELELGASSVNKYLLENNGKKYLLRLYDLRFMQSRYNAFNNMKILCQNGIKVPNVYEFGELNSIKKGYAIIEWIEGQPLNELLFNDKNSMKYGTIVADELKKMHQIINATNVNLKINYLNSLKKKIEKIKSLNININYDFIFEYVHENIDIITGKNVGIIHGDLHPGNIIVKNNEIYFIDLDVCKKDFVWIDLITNACNMDAPTFYTTLTSKYFKDNIPKNFWEIYNLYGILYCIDYILYCNRIKHKTLSNGVEKYEEFLDFTNNLSNMKPKWFNEKVLRKEL